MAILGYLPKFKKRSGSSFWCSFSAEVDSRLVKLVVMTNTFFNNQQHKVKIKQFI